MESLYIPVRVLNNRMQCAYDTDKLTYQLWTRRSLVEFLHVFNPFIDGIVLVIHAFKNIVWYGYLFTIVVVYEQKERQLLMIFMQFSNKKYRSLK